jgi:polysaccharide export outer membrane protein
MTAGPVNLGPGDLIDIGVFNSPELTTRVRVTSEGDITFPLLGKVHLVGMTPADVQGLLHDRLIAADLVKDPQVAVFVAEYANQAVYVLGEVGKPGAYPIMGSHRLYDFVSAAGGFTLRAGKSIVITRHAHPDAPEIVRFSRDPNFSAGNPDIGAGDTVYVKPAGVVYVVGDVNKPGGFLMDSEEQMTVVQAIAIAEGTKSTAKLGSAELIRNTDHGRTGTPVNLKKVLRLQAQDLVLHDQDILYIPNSALKSGLDKGMTSALGAAVGAAIYHF